MEKFQPKHGTEEHNLKMLLLNVINMSDAVLSSSNATIQIKVPEVHKEKKKIKKRTL